MGITFSQDITSVSVYIIQLQYLRLSDKRYQDEFPFIGTQIAKIVEREKTSIQKE